MEARPYLREISLRDNTEREQQYPFSIPAIREMGTVTFHRDPTFFVGENGTGKSTLLEAIAVLRGLNAACGSKNFRFSRRARESELSGSLRMVHSFRRPRDSFFLRAENFFNLATHSPSLLGYPECLILQLDDKGLSKIEYEQTGHHTLTRRFMNDHGRMLKELFSDDDEA